MKRFIYSFVAILAMSFGANAEETVPAQIHVLGAGASTINGVQGSWTIDKAVAVDVIDGKAVVNITNAVGAYHIYTCTVDEAVAGGWGADSPLNTTRIAAPSTAIADFGTLQNVVGGTETNFNENTDDNGAFGCGDVTIIFSDNLTKVTILPTSLFCVGNSTSTVNGTALDWNFDKAVKVEAEDGYFTLTASWSSLLFVSPWTTGGVWGKGVVGEGSVTEPFTTIPAEKLNRELPVAFNGTNLNPPFLSPTPYTIKISQDLKTIDYIVEARKCQLEVREGFWGAATLYDMTTTDGVTYTYTFDEAVPAGRVFTIINKNEYTDTAWRRNGTITFNTEEDWATAAGETESSAAEAFVGTVTAVIPSTMVTLDSGWGNKYWSDTPNAKVKFTPDTQTGGIGGIDTETGAPEYFNLHGVRVDNPENGIYIERLGTAVRKVMFK